MRVVVIIALAVVMLSLHSVHRRFTPGPSGALPAVSVP